MRAVAVAARSCPGVKAPSDALRAAGLAQAGAAAAAPRRPPPAAAAGGRGAAAPAPTMPAADSADSTTPTPWRRLRVPPAELRLDLCLTTGQSFRWRRVGGAGAAHADVVGPDGGGGGGGADRHHAWRGVVGRRVYDLRHCDALPEDAAAAAAAAGSAAPAASGDVEWRVVARGGAWAPAAGAPGPLGRPACLPSGDEAALRRYLNLPAPPGGGEGHGG